MSTLLWVVLPVLIALGSALIAVYIMQQRMEVQLARERQSLSEARASIEAQKSTLDELNELRQETARRKALDDFLADIKTEERHFVREQKMLFANRKSLVLQERLYFRNIPISNWVEHEVPIEEGADIESVAKSVAVFAPELLGPAEPPKKLKLLRQTLSAVTERL
jgi:ABC-type uncharacterized transport system fused permease/ATPase subunit